MNSSSSQQSNQSSNGQGIAELLSHMKYITVTISTLYGTVWILGIFGNIMSFLVNSRPKLRSTTLSLYLRILAVFDTMVVSFLCLFQPSEMYFGFFGGRAPKLLLKYLYCGFYLHFAYFTLLGSAWLVVAMTIDRSIHFFVPMKARTFCTNFKVKIIAGTIIGVNFSLFIFFYPLYGPGRLDIFLDSNNKWLFNYKCHASSERGTFFGHTIMMQYLMYAGSIIPCGLLLILNSAIIFSLAKSNKQRKALSESSKNSEDKKLNQLTITLVSISLYYAISTLPLYANNLAQYNSGAWSSSKVSDVRWVIYSNFFGPLGASNNALNFYIYCLTGKTFRNEFYHIIGLKSKAKNDSSSMSKKVFLQ